MGLTCCTQRETKSEYLDEVQREMDRQFQSHINIKPLVNMIPEGRKRGGQFKETPSKSIRAPHDQAQIQDKFDLKVDLLLEHLKVDLKQLRRNHGSNDNPEFQKQLIVLIGANTREISKLVVSLYESRRMLALEKLQNTSCRVGPKMDQSISGGSRSRTDDTMNDQARNSARKARRNMAKNGGFATERTWIDARLAYRRIVYRMIRSIEAHCDDVICLTQNFLQLSKQ